MSAIPLERLSEQDWQYVADAADLDFHTWTDNTEKYSVEAVFLAQEAGRVRLRRRDGQVIELSLERLSKEDREWMKDRESEDPHKSEDPAVQQLDKPRN